MNTFPFCTDKNISIRLIYKDDLVMVFPTNIPITPGHVLICPVRHVSKVDDLTAKEFSAIQHVLIKIKAALKKSLRAEGFNVAWNEGGIAGQAVEHLHIHVVPRTEGDMGIYEYDPRKFLYRPGSRSESPLEELREVAEIIKNNLS